MYKYIDIVSRENNDIIYCKIINERNVILIVRVSYFLGFFLFFGLFFEF